MKRKTLLIVALALVIVGSMLAGTMAQYVVESPWFDANPVFKQFNFTADKTAETALQVGIAPGETKTWTFRLTNQDGNVVSETAMLVDLHFIIDSGMPAGMEFKLNGNPISGVGQIPVADWAANAPASQDITLTATWNHSANDISFEGDASKHVKLKFIAQQKLTAVVDSSKLVNVIETGWYNDNTLLDTEVLFNFDNIRIADIKSVKFTLFDGNKVLGTRISTGNNLVTLWNDCAQYWDCNGNYLNVKGEKWLSCAFKTRAAESDNGYWVSSASTLAAPLRPSKVLVEVLAGDTLYKAELIK